MKDRIFNVAIDENEQELFSKLLENLSSEGKVPSYDELPSEYKKIINEYEYSLLKEKLFDVEKVTPKYTKVFMLVDYINAFTTGSLGSEYAVDIEDNILYRLNKAMNEEHTAVVVLIDAHYNDESYYLKSREGRHLPILHANTSEERMIYGKVGEELKSYYDTDSNSYETDENAGVFFIYKSGFGSMDAPHIMNYEQSRFTDKILELEDDLMGSSMVKKIEAETYPTYEWNLLRYMASNIAKLESDITEIEIAGVATNICVLSNAVLCQSMLPQAEIYIMDDCVASYDYDLHKKALDVMEGLGINVIKK